MTMAPPPLRPVFNPGYALACIPMYKLHIYLKVFSLKCVQKSIQYFSKYDIRIQMWKKQKTSLHTQTATVVLLLLVYIM